MAMNVLGADLGLGLVAVPLTALPLASAGQYFFGILLSVTSVFLILLILIQRGRGGGLAGAFGGMGGQSAFGTKAGDTFTRITIVVSVLWILVCVFSVMFLSSSKGPLGKATPIGETNLDSLPVNPPGGAESTLPSDPGTPSSGATSGSTTSSDAPGDAASSAAGTAAPAGTESAAGTAPAASEGATPAGAASTTLTPGPTETPASSPEVPAAGTNP